MNGRGALASAGHTVKLMAPKFVLPYRKSGKNEHRPACGRGSR